jgi:hypothetical protein
MPGAATAALLLLLSAAAAALLCVTRWMKQRVSLRDDFSAFATAARWNGIAAPKERLIQFWGPCLNMNIRKSLQSLARTSVGQKNRVPLESRRGRGILNLSHLCCRGPDISTLINFITPKICGNSPKTPNRRSPTEFPGHLAVPDFQLQRSMFLEFFGQIRNGHQPQNSNFLT